MQFWKPALITLLIFGLGGIAGWLVCAKVTQTSIVRVRQGQEGLPPIITRERAAHMADVMTRQLQLTPDQRLKAMELLNRMNMSLQPTREHLRRESRRLMMETDRALEALLTPNQRKEFEEFRKRRRALFKQWQNPNNPPRPPAAGVP